LTALPIAPDELSTCSNASETFSSNNSAPSTPAPNVYDRMTLAFAKPATEAQAH
jgi:hypothetical protein